MAADVDSLYDEVCLHAEVALRAMAPDALSGWAALGDAPILAKASLAYSHEVADEKLGSAMVDQKFEKVLGPRRWAILRTAMGKGRR